MPRPTRAAPAPASRAAPAPSSPRPKASPEQLPWMRDGGALQEELQQHMARGRGDSPPGGAPAAYSGALHQRRRATAGWLPRARPRAARGGGGGSPELDLARQGAAAAAPLSSTSRGKGRRLLRARRRDRCCWRGLLAGRVLLERPGDLEARGGGGVWQGLLSPAAATIGT
jgi:hypothetical protein